MQDEEPISSQDRRLQKILFLLKRRGRVSVGELSALFGVSLVTIRADLTELERQGLVVRSYGGASLVSDAAEAKNGRDEPPVESAAIGRRAAALVKSEDTIYLDGSPEALALADNLGGLEPLTVLTSSLELALKLCRNSGLRVYISGGRAGPDGTVVGPGSFLNPSELRADKCFVGASGASEDGLFDSGFEGAGLKRQILSNSRERYLLLRSARWGKATSFDFSPLEGVDGIVTDAAYPRSMADSCASRKVRLIADAERGRPAGAYGVFEAYRAAAAEGLPYEGSPGKGKRLAFANGNRSEPFCLRLEEGLVRNAVLAGFAEEDILILDNGYDPERAVENARRIVEWGADVVVDFNADAASNGRIAELFRNARIPAVAMEGAMPSAPFVGANNWRAGSLAGEHAARLIAEKLGGWDQVDRVILVEMESAGELVLLRTEAFAAALEAAFGEEAEAKVLRVLGGNQYADARRAVEKVLPDLNAGGRYVVTAVNAEALQGAVDALAGAGLWRADAVVCLSHGDGEVIREQLARGIADAAVIYHAERYGAAAVPAACALLGRAAVPPYVYIEQSLEVKEPS